MKFVWKKKRFLKKQKRKIIIVYSSTIVYNSIVLKHSIILQKAFMVFLSFF